MMHKGRQIVHAAKRGDRCYDGKRGRYHHALDAQSGIDESSIKGPFASSDLAHADIEVNH